MIDDISAARRKELEDKFKVLFDKEFDEDISPFRIGRLVDVMLSALGPAIYNQAVQDVREHFQAKLDDLDGDVYWPEDGDGDLTQV